MRSSPALALATPTVDETPDLPDGDCRAVAQETKDGLGAAAEDAALHLASAEAEFAQAATAQQRALLTAGDRPALIPAGASCRGEEVSAASLLSRAHGGAEGPKPWEERWPRRLSGTACAEARVPPSIACASWRVGGPIQEATVFRN